MILTLTILLIVCILVTAGLLIYDSTGRGITDKSLEHNFADLPVSGHPDLRSNEVSDEEKSLLNVTPKRSEEEEATRELIGDKKYEAMSERVSELLERHKNDQFRSVMLTAGSIEKNALRTLHALLPGDSVRLQDNSRHGIPDVGVYVGDERVGRLLLDDATEALNALKGTLVTGAYVAEQNSYGEESKTISIKLIIFFTTADVSVKQVSDPLKTPYKLIYRGLRPIVIYQN